MEAVVRTELCDRCHGRGEVIVSSDTLHPLVMRCPTCDGRRVLHWEPDPDSPWGKEPAPCG